MKLRLKISLRLKFILYLVFVHLLFAGVAIYLISKHRLWLLAVEAVFVISLAVGGSIIRNLFGTVALINPGAHFIGDTDSTAHFRTVGQPGLDHMVRLYNRAAAGI